MPHSRSLLDLVSKLESRLRPASPSVQLALSQLRTAARGAVATEQELDRYRELLRRMVEPEDSGLSPVALGTLHAMLSVLGATRGFLGLIREDGTRTVVASANDKGESIEAPETALSSTVLQQAIDTGQPVVADDAGSGPLGQAPSIAVLAMRSIACFPLGGDRTIGFVYLDNADRPGLFDVAAIDTIERWLPVLSARVERALERESVKGLGGVVTRSPEFQAQLDELSRVASRDVPILLYGETGTGKTYIARRLHEASPRAQAPFVHVNCGAIPESLIESELFGVEAGAFTGAKASRPGRFEDARGGTLFLDELDLMSPECQVKLLTAVQDRRTQRLGSSTPVDVDVRFVSAMSSHPDDSIAAGRLREELYYRLAVIVAEVPPLRDRIDDVPLLVRHAMQRARTRFDLPELSVSDDALRSLLDHQWPGNVRELENTVDRSALLAEDGVIQSIRFDQRRRKPVGASRPVLAGRQEPVARPTFARRRYGISRDEFLAAWSDGMGSAQAVADALGVHVRTVFRLRKKFQDGSLASK